MSTLYFLNESEIGEFWFRADFLTLKNMVLMTAGAEAFEGFRAKEGVAGSAHGGFRCGKGLLIDVHFRKCLIYL